MDIMNRNTITSLSMLYALWQSERKDLLDVIRPFVLYTIGETTSGGNRIDIEAVCVFMEKEFGYKYVQPAVVERILRRETARSIPKDERLIKKLNGDFYLVGSLNGFVEKFKEKRAACKSHSDIVIKELVEYLNSYHIKNENFTRAEVETLLLAFFERQGERLILATEELNCIKAKHNEIEYYIGKFILNEYERKTIIIEYIEDLVKGYFITTALYLQADNPDITRASFNDVTFYLDTRLLLAFLGYKTVQENTSVQKMVKSIQNNGAKVACFSYNIDEVESILEAYKQSTLDNKQRQSTITLEYFDENKYSYTQVDAEQKFFEKKLQVANITPVSTEQALRKEGVREETIGFIDDSHIEKLILEIKPNYNRTTLPDDLNAINTISRIRKGKKRPHIERCKAVFVTPNNVLVAAIKKYLRNIDADLGFPIAITGEDLCVIAWLKDFEESGDLPKFRLLENVMTAVTPTRDWMEAFFDNLEKMESLGTLSGDEAALLRMDLFVRKELMEKTVGAKDNLNVAIIESVRNKIRNENMEAGFKAGEAHAKEEHRAEMRRKRASACKQAEEEVEIEYQRKETRRIVAIKLLSILIAIAFLVASIVSFCKQWESAAKISFLIVTFVTTAQAIRPFCTNDTWLIKCAKKKLQQEKLKMIDKRKEKYLSLIEES